MAFTLLGRGRKSKPRDSCPLIEPRDWQSGGNSLKEYSSDHASNHGSKVPLQQGEGFACLGGPW